MSVSTIKKNRDAEKAGRERDRAAGVCIWHSCSTQTAGLAYCDMHRAHIGARMSARYKRLREAGLCLECRLPSGGPSRCAGCVERKKAGRE